MPFAKESFFIEEPIKAFSFLMKNFNISMGEAQKMIARKRVFMNDEVMNHTAGLIYGKVQVVRFQPNSMGTKPIFKDDRCVIFDKPSGILVHPQNIATPYCMLDEIRFYGGDKANPVHRIDMETSGLLMASCTKEAENYLKVAFEEKKVQKSYLAWVNGCVERDFHIDEPLKSNNDYRQTKHKTQVSSEGKTSQTSFKMLSYDEKLDISLLECTPHTGRTHQIRVHLFHAGFPIIGDPLYGRTFEQGYDYLEGKMSQEQRIETSRASRLMLHAQTLRFDYWDQIYTIESQMDFLALKKDIF